MLQLMYAVKKLIVFINYSLIFFFFFWNQLHSVRVINAHITPHTLDAIVIL